MVTFRASGEVVAKKMVNSIPEFAHVGHNGIYFKSSIFNAWVSGFVEAYHPSPFESIATVYWLMAQK